MTSSDVEEDIKQMIEEDLHSGDVTTESLISEDVKAKGVMIANQSGYIAGIDEVAMIFKELGTEFKPRVKDGGKIESGEILGEVEGKARKILAAERVALNLLSRMSGIATATMELMEKAEEGNPDVKIAATRKTAPLLRRFDKKAVEAVEAEPHRYHLGDFVLIKDNHLKLVGSVSEAVKKAKEAGLSDKVEVEVDDKEELVSAIKGGADIVMLDNFDVNEAEEAVKMLEEEDLRDEVLLEASGGIDLSNVKDFAAAGVDIISTSYMTMQAPALDIKFDLSEKL